MGVFERLFGAVAEDPDLEWLMIDATILRAQAQAAGARRKRGGAEAQALGRSRGGFGTKLHAVVDALGGNVRGKPAWAVGRNFVMFPTCPLTRSAISKPRPRLSVLR